MVDFFLPPSSLFIAPIEGFIATEESAPLGNNRLEILKRFEHTIPGPPTPRTNLLCRLGDPESCQTVIPRISTPRINITVAPRQS
eukprot:2136533-Pyramimonas_sp.AAC.1